MVRSALLILFVVGALALAGCGAQQESPTIDLNLPNPASLKCQQDGGTLAMRQDASGGTAGICQFPDASECDEWAYFRGECKRGDKPSMPPGSAAPTRPSLAVAATPTGDL